MRLGGFPSSLALAFVRLARNSRQPAAGGSRTEKEQEARSWMALVKRRDFADRMAGCCVLLPDRGRRRCRTFSRLKSGGVFGSSDSSVDSGSRSRSRSRSR